MGAYIRFVVERSRPSELDTPVNYMDPSRRGVMLESNMMDLD